MNQKNPELTVLTRAIALSIPVIISACSGTPARDSGPRPGSVNVSSIPDAEPRMESRSKYGNPSSYEVFGKRYYVMASSQGYVERGIASWYGNKFHGRRTSNGETYDMYAMTAAHKSLPLPTYVEVVNLKNGKRVVVRVNDRGPFHENRIIDLSYTAAAKLDIIGTGTGLVEVRAIDPARYAKVGEDNRPTTMPVGAPVRTASTDTATQGNSFFIQVGAFSSLLNAEGLRDRLDRIQQTPVGIKEALVGGKTLYRVRIGPVKDIDVADNIVSSLGKEGIYEHHIVLD